MAMTGTIPDTGSPLPGLPRSREALGRLRRLHEHFVADPHHTDLSDLRPVIARSWMRSIACNVDANTKFFAEVRQHQIDEQVLRLAQPIVANLEQMAQHTGACISLTDPLGTSALFRGNREVLRWASSRFSTQGAFMPEDITGTNSDGTALEEGASVQVWGAEHFAEGFHECFCTSVPIRDPLRGTIKAVLSLTVPERVALDTDPRALSLIVEGAAADLRRSLTARLAVREQALLSAYLREVRKRGAEAVLAIDERTTIANSRGQQTLTPADFAVIAAYAKESESHADAVERTLTISGDRAVAMCATPVTVDDRTVGSVVRIRRIAPSEHVVRVPRTSQRDHLGSSIVGTSRPIRHALDLATTALSQRMPVHLVGEAGSGKLQMAQAISATLATTTVIVDGADPNARRVGVGQLTTSALEAGAAVILRRVDELSPEQALALLADVAEMPTERLLLTARTLNEVVMSVIGGIHSFEITLPALRMRREDIPALVDHFLDCSPPPRAHVSLQLMQTLAKADWPGNVGQLKDVVQSAAARASTASIELEDLAEVHRKAMGRGQLSRLEEAELHHIRQALAEAGGNRVRASELLEIGRSTLYRKIDTYTRRGFDLGL